jgi:hypothetical protein
MEQNSFKHKYLTFVSVTNGKPKEAIDGIPETEDEKKRL